MEDEEKVFTVVHAAMKCQNNFWKKISKNILVN